jgi:hypothetical protein
MKLTAGISRHRRHWRGRATRSGDTVKLASRIRGEDDYIIGVPRATSCSDSDVANNLRSSSGNVDGLKLSAREEPDFPPVRGPEREACIFGIPHWLRLGGTGRAPTETFCLGRRQPRRRAGIHLVIAQNVARRTPCPRGPL